MSELLPAADCCPPALFERIDALRLRSILNKLRQIEEDLHSAFEPATVGFATYMAKRLTPAVIDLARLDVYEVETLSIAPVIAGINHITEIDMTHYMSRNVANLYQSLNTSS
jgi:hypothetical protein